MTHLKDLKGAVADAIVSLLGPVQKRFEENKEWQAVIELAYPSLVAEKKRKRVRVFIPSLTVRRLRRVSVGESVSPSSTGKGKQNAIPADR